MSAKILAPIITPNATWYDEFKCSIYKTFNHHSIGQSSNFPIQRDKGGTASSKIRPNSTVCNKAVLLIMVTLCLRTKKKIANIPKYSCG
jgi:hypothetical protein